MGEVELSLERKPRAMQELLPRAAVVSSVETIEKSR